MKTFVQRIILFLSVVLLGLGADLWTKSWVFRMLGMPWKKAPYWIIEDVFGFQTALNHGALFGAGQGYSFVFCAISVVAVILILVWLFWYGYSKSFLWTLALGMITAGILGNMYDRLGLHMLRYSKPTAYYDNFYEEGKPIYAVRDWILVMYPWPNFGTAESPEDEPEVKNRHWFSWYHWPNFNIADSLLVCGAILVCGATYFLEPPTVGQKEEKPAEIS